MRHGTQKNTGRLNAGWILMGGLAILGTAGCLDMTAAEIGEEQVDKAGIFPSKVILDWSAHTENAMVVDSGNINPLPATRVLSMVHVAMHDAINSTDPLFERYAFTGNDPIAHPVAAAAAAAHRVLVNQFPAQAADLDAKLAASLVDVPNGTAETRGVTLGSAAGNFIFQLRANDGAAAAANVPYTPGTGPGKYQFVPPFDFVNLPGWHFVTPWVLDSANQFRSAPPPSLGSISYRNAYNEVKLAGILVGSDRSADETRYAKFWYENSDTGWNRIARVVTQSKGLKLYSTARLFALMNMAMADGFIAGWDSKFHYDFWRPRTAIRFPDDGNSGTSTDPSWEPLLDTPPVQDYPSTHSVLGAAAAEVLGRILGDRTSFTFTSSTAEQPFVETRSFTRFSQAANENADSRVQAGIHFRFATNAGLTLGDQVGEVAYEDFLRPL
jgi:PAP2 superfamily